MDIDPTVRRSEIDEIDVDGRFIRDRQVGWYIIVNYYSVLKVSKM